MERFNLEKNAEHHPLPEGQEIKHLVSHFLLKSVVNRNLKWMNETGWSSEIVDHCRTQEELNHYRQLGLQECQLDGQIALVQPSLDIAQIVDARGRTNLDLMREGLAPIVDGQRLELHHIGQFDDSPLAELTFKQHRGSDIDSILHIKGIKSEIDRTAFNKRRQEHWKARARQLEKL